MMHGTRSRVLGVARLQAAAGCRLKNYLSATLPYGSAARPLRARHIVRKSALHPFYNPYAIDTEEDSAVTPDAPPAELLPLGDEPFMVDVPEDRSEAELFSSTPCADGTLEVLKIAPLSVDTFHAPIEGAEPVSRCLRIWLPPNHSRSGAPVGGYPVLVLNDGQNLFGDCPTMSGKDWAVAAAASELIADGRIPPCVIVGVDNAGAWRPFDYLPFPPGEAGGFRPEAATWPGGGVEHYAKSILDEVLPLSAKRYGCSEDPARTAFGGSSFGGICALWLQMLHPGRFGGLLVESPSFWMAEGRALYDTLAHKGPWPERLFLAMGTKEYSGLRDGEGPEVDTLLAESVRRLGEKLSADGLGPDRLSVVLGNGATHTEAAWAARFPKALEFIGSAWWRAPEGSALPAGADAALAEASAAARWLLDDRAASVPATSADAEPHSDSRFFVWPREPTAGHKATIYFNRAISKLADSPNICAKIGFNGWSNVIEATCQSTNFWRGARTDWWAATVTIPKGATEMNWAMRDGTGRKWDNNDGKDFRMEVFCPNYYPDGMAPADADAAAAAAAAAASTSAVAAAIVAVSTAAIADAPAGAVAAAVAAAASAASVAAALTEAAGASSVAPTPVVQVVGSRRSLSRRIASRQTKALAGGVLHIIELEKRSSKAGRWSEEKVLRVWVPPGYDPANAPPGGYPLAVIADGQNLFEDETAHQKVSWRAAEAAAGLIACGAVKPFIVAGIDGSGVFRSLNYLPYPPGTGAGGFRSDCERWPGGGVDAYVSRVVEDYLPLLEDNFACATDRGRRIFGGASFGGIAALHMAQRASEVFAGIIAESPSLWVSEGKYLQDMRERAHGAGRPDRVFLGVGTREYSGTRDHERRDVDDLLLKYAREAAHFLQHERNVNLKFVVDEGAGHHEGAWAWRLSGAFQFLLGHLQ